MGLRSLYFIWRQCSPSLNKGWCDIRTCWCWYYCVYLPAGAPQAITGTLERWVALANGVTAAPVALSTATVTAGPGSVSAGQAPQASGATNANRGTFCWKAFVFVGIFPPLNVQRFFSLSNVSLSWHRQDKVGVSASYLRIWQARLREEIHLEFIAIRPSQRWANALWSLEQQKETHTWPQIHAGHQLFLSVWPQGSHWSDLRLKGIVWE